MYNLYNPRGALAGGLRIAAAVVLAAGSLLPFAGTARAATTLNMHITTGPSSSAVGQQVGVLITSDPLTLTATTPNPSGTFTLYDGTTQIAEDTARGWLPTISDQHQIYGYFPITLQTVGTHNLRAVYSGDPNYAETADATFAQGVSQTASCPCANYATSTAGGVVDESGAFNLGQGQTPYGYPPQVFAFVFALNVPATAPSLIGVAAPTGTLTFGLDGSSLTPSAIRADFPTSAFTGSLRLPVEPLGLHTFSANYNGDTTFSNLTFSPSTSNPAATSALSSYTVVASHTATSFTASSTGPGVSMSATVDPLYGSFNGCSLAPATGNMAFMEGGNVIATRAVGDTTYAGPYGTCHRASVSGVTVALPAGTHSLSAVYQGDGNFLTSTSRAQSVTTSGVPISLIVPADISTNATSTSGAKVNYVTSTTGGSGTVTVACSPASGAVFPIGTTTVSCTASDAAGDTASGSFQVSVAGPLAQAQILASAVNGVGPGSSLANKLATIIQSLSANPVDTAGACSNLAAFINQVNAQSGKAIPASTAASLIQQAKQIEAATGC
jgi:hypothetical protein